MTNELLIELLQDCRDYFDNRSDVLDGDGGQPIANTEMRLMGRIDATLDRLKPTERLFKNARTQAEIGQV